MRRRRARPRDWLIPLPAGIAVAIAALIAYENTLGSGSFGPVVLLGFLATTAATMVMLVSPRVLRWRRMTRALACWAGLMFLFTLSQAAHQCGAHDATCSSSGDALEAMALWLGGTIVLGGLWALTRPGGLLTTQRLKSGERKSSMARTQPIRRNELTSSK